MGKKPSFFEKLTGKPEVTEEEKKLNLASQSRQIKPMEPETNTSFNQPEETKEWPPEAEGQLTIDVYQTPNDICIQSTIAGVKPEDLDITITNDMVTIKGKREKDEIIKSEDYYAQECYWGSFSRTVILPMDIDAEKAEASLKNGILTVRLPKLEKTKTKKITVKTV